MSNVVGPNGSSTRTKHQTVVDPGGRYRTDPGYLDLTLSSMGQTIVSTSADYKADLLNSNAAVVGAGGSYNTGRSRL